jgi:hypothetical protein
MIINNLNVIRVAVAPAEADAPLGIDSYAVLPFPVSRQGFQTVRRRNPKVRKRPGIVQHPQFPPRYLLDIAGQTPRNLPLPHLFRLPSSKTPDHASTITHRVIAVKRIERGGTPHLHIIEKN